MINTARVEEFVEDAKEAVDDIFSGMVGAFASELSDTFDLLAGLCNQMASTLDDLQYSVSDEGSEEE